MSHRWLCLLGLVLAMAPTAEAGEKARSVDEVRTTLNGLLTGKGDEAAQALERLKAYRYLAQVPYEDVTLDRGYNEMCLAAARLCAKIGRLEHQPKNPGLPEA